MYLKLFDKELVDLNCISCSQQTSLNPELPSDGIGQQGQTSGTSSQGQIPGTSTQGQIPGTNTQGQIPGTGGLVYDEPNTGPRNLSSVL